MTYRGEYRCQDCGHDFDPLVRANKDEVRCPRCGSVSLERSPYLFGTADADELTLQDYISTLLQVCCGDSSRLPYCPFPGAQKQQEKEEDG